MIRHLLPAVLLVLTAPAFADSPARQDANGGGGPACPPNEVSAARTDGETPPPSQATELRSAAPDAAVPVTGKDSSTRPRDARWHSFLPGMFK